MGRGVDIFNFTREELEDYIDAVKPVVVRGLVSSGLITDEEGEEWCENHTILLRKKNIFRTLTDKWKKDKEADGRYIIVVKKTI